MFCCYIVNIKHFCFSLPKQEPNPFHNHRRLVIGELALKELHRLSTEKVQLASAHELMSHIYTSSGCVEQAAEIRLAMKNETLYKLPGESLNEVDGVML